jgi:hypothetical protein
MDAPNFIFEMFEEELTRIQRELLSKVASKYNLDEQTLHTEFLEKRVKLIPNSEVTVVVKKQVVKKQKVAEQSRCPARIWNRGRGGQCTRPKKTNDDDTVCEFCAQHMTNRKHGVITEPVDKKIFPKHPTAIYK